MERAAWPLALNYHGRDAMDPVQHPDCPWGKPPVVKPPRAADRLALIDADFVVVLDRLAGAENAHARRCARNSGCSIRARCVALLRRSHTAHTAWHLGHCRAYLGGSSHRAERRPLRSCHPHSNQDVAARLRARALSRAQRPVGVR